MGRLGWAFFLPWIAVRLAASPSFPAVKAVPAFPKLSFHQPVFLTCAPDGSHRLFVVEQPGRVMAFPQDGSSPASPFLDIRPKVRLGEEEGLLCLAFHPEF